jgi:hypothetical protein
VKSNISHSIGFQKSLNDSTLSDIDPSLLNNENNNSMITMRTNNYLESTDNNMKSLNTESLFNSSKPKFDFNSSLNKKGVFHVFPVN